MLEGYTRLELLVIALVVVLFFVGCAILFTYDPKAFKVKPAVKKRAKATAKKPAAKKGLVNTQPRVAPSDEQLAKEYREFQIFKKQRERSWFN